MNDPSAGYPHGAHRIRQEHLDTPGPPGTDGTTCRSSAVSLTLPRIFTTSSTEVPQSTTTVPGPAIKPAGGGEVPRITIPARPVSFAEVHVENTVPVSPTNSMAEYQNLSPSREGSTCQRIAAAALPSPAHQTLSNEVVAHEKESRVSPLSSQGERRMPTQNINVTTLGLANRELLSNVPSAVTSESILLSSLAINSNFNSNLFSPSAGQHGSGVERTSMVAMVPSPQGDRFRGSGGGGGGGGSGGGGSCAVVIPRSALGRSVNLGDLYNIGTDKFCHETGGCIRLFTTDSMGQSSRACPSIHVQHVFDDSLRTRFEAQRVNPAHKLSILGGLSCAQGSAGHFLEMRDAVGAAEKDTIKATLFCHVIASEQHLQLSSFSSPSSSQYLSREVESILARSSNWATRATHFVSGIVRGATVVASIKGRAQGGRCGRSDLQVSLGKRLAAIQTALSNAASSSSSPTSSQGWSLGAGGGGGHSCHLGVLSGVGGGGQSVASPLSGGPAEQNKGWGKEDVDERAFSVRIFADFLGKAGSGESSQTLQELEEALQCVSRLQGENQGQAVPVLFYLFPLVDLLRSAYNYNVMPLHLQPAAQDDPSLVLLHPDEDTIARTERHFQELYDLAADVDILDYELQEAIKAHGNAVVSEHITCVDSLRRNLMAAMQELRARVSDMTVTVRFSQGRQDSSALTYVLDDIQQQWAPHVHRDVVVRLSARIKNRVSFLNDLKHAGINFASGDYENESAIIDAILSEHGEGRVYILVSYVEEAAHDEIWRKNLELLKKLVIDHTGGSPHLQNKAEGKGRGRDEEQHKAPPTSSHPIAPSFFFLELTASVDSSNDPPEDNLPSSVIRLYHNRRLVQDDVAEHMDKVAALCLVRYSEVERIGAAGTSREGGPHKTAPLRIQCPGTVYSRCGTEVKDWHCEKCVTQVEYGWDSYVYCDCGRAQLESIAYLCRHAQHRDGQFMRYGPTDDLTTELNKLQMKQEINILLLGETGVGKSTFINAFANYLTFEEMHHVKDDLMALIPSQFTVCQLGDYTGVKVCIGTKDDDNEEVGAGKSSTQSCKSYLFDYGKYKVRLIDTPGIGDTRGIEQDKKNFDNILRFLGHHTLIHGICILLKPNSARLNVLFRFCIMELLCHLHKSAKDNIVFVFTNARSTFYRPGDTMPPLMEMLKKVRDAPPHVRIEVSESTIYCLDNESFRFLAAAKQGVKFSDEQTADFARSWEISVNECRRLMNYVIGRNPHKVQDTVSVNEARRLILRLARPLGDISRLIQLNKQMMEEKMNEDLSSTNHISELRQQLFVPAVDLEYRKLDHPHTVCAANAHRDIVMVAGVAKYDYKTRCHTPCYLTNVDVETTNNPALRRCAAMGSGGNCNSCGCSWTVHMHVLTETKLIKIEQRDASIQERIKTVEDAKEEHQRNIQQMKERSKKLDEEQKAISKTLARFAVFLKCNAITPYNDSTLGYLNHLIDEEMNLRAAGAKNAEILNGLIKMKASYEEEVKILTTAMLDRSAVVDSSVFISAEEIQNNIQQLFALEINGPKIKQAMEELQKAHAEYFAYKETVVRTSSRGPWFLGNSASRRRNHQRTPNKAPAARQSQSQRQRHSLEYQGQRQQGAYMQGGVRSRAADSSFCYQQAGHHIPRGRNTQDPDSHGWGGNGYGGGPESDDYARKHWHYVHDDYHVTQRRGHEHYMQNEFSAQVAGNRHFMTDASGGPNDFRHGGVTLAGFSAKRRGGEKMPMQSFSLQTPASPMSPGGGPGRRRDTDPDDRGQSQPPSFLGSFWPFGAFRQ
ncbi:hypothetical protein CBR_g68530 [Chara braunii]|uniref:DUF8206 domain-containing protein n=1 Tax=Chara braunii TaxID=69332 RepID=A0A388MFZ6_CHABU|nr:hypothetical protein CBR_g68530 [Chara braunii]|eukprot:GBG93402.1 hypothetical protein CBR_g68530 [Chara braunii]